MKEITLEFLRKKVADGEDCLDYIGNKKLKDVDEHDHNAYAYTQGEIAAYEEMLAFMQGLTYREAQLAKKKGTL